MNVLRLAVEFSERWREGVERFGLPEAEKIEVNFSRCSHFLVSCLNNAIKRGHFPHCECVSVRQLYMDGSSVVLLRHS